MKTLKPESPKARQINVHAGIASALSVHKEEKSMFAENLDEMDGTKKSDSHLYDMFASKIQTVLANEEYSKLLSFSALA